MNNRILVKIPVSQKKIYPVLIGTRLLAQETWLPKNLFISRVVIITDHTVKKLYASELIHALKKHGHNPLLLSFLAGEKSKNDKTKQYLEKQMLRHHCGRDTLCIALGGGVVGDLAGYISATYMRGISYIQIPTTLLGMVDSSVGGKTGINNAYGKNVIGAFWQPEAVLADVNCLKSLPKKHLVNGLIESLKMFLTHDAKSFFYVQKNLQALLKKDELKLTHVIRRSVKIKAHIVGEDEKENGLRSVLNFGHTIGHALEQVSHYKLLHGHAVAFGIWIEAKISCLMGILNHRDYLMIETILFQIGFNAEILKKFNVEKIIQATRFDKKNSRGQTQYILLKSIGEVHILKSIYSHAIPDKVVRKAFLAIIGA